ncbi:hypothetical protein GGR50DRAFT_457645 [Xylaria sp. CBS 124048]|nr:hypothetical protein GGR50DRAFT_457645 [Xylaria sp. CBS 124048]
MQSSTLAESFFSHLRKIHSRRLGNQQRRVSTNRLLIACHHHTAPTVKPRQSTVIASTRRPQPSPTMSTGTRPSSSSAKAKAPPPEPSPSASILLLSPTNQVLLLRRVKTSTSFASAHVFPGGNLSDFHDGPIPPAGEAGRHVDSPAYRLGAIRETFEESGILLARRGGHMLHVPGAERDRARKAIYENKVGFAAWVESVGGVIDTENLLPFTRWITPLGPPKRFTTQMYIYMLPLEDDDLDPVVSAAQNEALIPTPDGGAEITSAHFDDAATWLRRQHEGNVTLFPPQLFLLHLLSQFLTGPGAGMGKEARGHYAEQRDRLREFLDGIPTSSKHKEHSTSSIPWAEKVISPVMIGVREDGRSVLALDKPGRELLGSERGGDWERVVLVRFGKKGPSEVEVRDREEVLAEERARAKVETSKL